MKCEIRKSCSLRNVVYEIGKLSAPVGIILVDTTDIKSTELFKSPRDKFWQELKIVFRDVGQAYEYTLEEDVHRHLSESSTKSPVLIEIGADRILPREHFNALLERLQNLGLKRLVMVLIAYGLNGVVHADNLISSLNLREDPGKSNGVDMLIIVDDIDTVHVK